MFCIHNFSARPPVWVFPIPEQTLWLLIQRNGHSKDVESSGGLYLGNKRYPTNVSGQHHVPRDVRQRCYTRLMTASNRKGLVTISLERSRWVRKRDVDSYEYIGACSPLRLEWIKCYFWILLPVRGRMNPVAIRPTDCTLFATVTTKTSSAIAILTANERCHLKRARPPKMRRQW